MKRRVVIVGGGFGGVRCAKALRRLVPPAVCEVVLFDRENHMVFHPLLAEVAGSSVGADAVAAPLREMLRGVRCRTESVTGIDLEARCLTFEGSDGRPGTMSYDHIVIACGRTVELGGIPGMADHAFAFKTVGDALALRAHVIQQLERAETCDDAAHRQELLRFVVVGGGFSGVEVAGEINDLARASRRRYPNVREDEIRVTLVHSSGQILPEISPRLRDFARRKMERAGVVMVLDARAAAATAAGVRLADGRVLHAGTIVCTIGTRPAPLVARMDARKEKGALLAQCDLRLEGREDAWAIGDCARIPNAATGTFCPPTGQFAERQGRQVAANIARVLRGRPTRAFAFRPLGQLCAIGGRSAVAEIMGVRLSGFIAWLLWRAVYLAKLPSWARRVKVGIGWIWELLFSRDLLTLRADTTERVSRAYVPAGETIFREGDPALSFYALEKGEVEVLRDGRRVAVLGPGDYFGEMALLESRPRSATVRALDDVEVTVLGAQVFARLSKSLAPLQGMLVESLRRRSPDAPLRMPFAHAVLQREPLATFVDPAPPVLGAGRPLDEALEIFAAERADLLGVLDPAGRLIGVMTRTDLLRAIDAAMAAPAAQRGEFTVGRFMTAHPAFVTESDPATAAAALLWSRGLKLVPVVDDAARRRVIGCVRTETLMHRVASQLPGAAGPAAVS